MSQLHAALPSTCETWRLPRRAAAGFLFIVGFSFSVLALMLDSKVLGSALLRMIVLVSPWLLGIFLLARRLVTRRSYPWIAYNLGVALPWFLIFGVPLALVAGEYMRRTDFDPAAWRAAAAVPDIRGPSEDRIRMVDDLLDSRILDGRTRKDVEALLGPDDGPRGTGYGAGYFRDWDAMYWLGVERSFFAIDSEWLLIRYDEDGRVRGYRLARD